MIRLGAVCFFALWVVTPQIWAQQTKFEFLGKTSMRYSDAGPDGFCLDELGFRTLLEDGSVRFCALAATHPDFVVKEAWVQTSLFERERWRQRLYLKAGLLRIPFGYSQRYLEHDLSLGYPRVALRMFDEGLGFFDLGVAFGFKFVTARGGLEGEVAVLRGEYLGGKESDKAKAICAQIRMLMVEGVEFGVSWYDGSRVTYYDWAHPAVETNRDRFGAHSAFRYRLFSALFECIFANDGNAVERDRDSLGYCAELGVFVWRNFRYWDPQRNLHCGVQALFRVDMYRPPRDYVMRILTGRSTRSQLTYTFALSFNIHPSLRVLVFFSHRDWGPYFEAGEGDDRAGIVLFLRL